MENCLFCRIASGEIPSNKVYEDEKVLAFRDIDPQAPVHVLLIPKQHFDDLESLDDEIASKVFPLAKKMMKLLKEKLGWDGFNVVQNNGEVAGQTVFHFHVHLIPRYKGDGHVINMKQTQPEEGALESVLKEIIS